MIEARSETIAGLKDAREPPSQGMRAASAAAATKSLQLRPTLCDPIDGSPPGSPIPGILQARTPEWVAISFPSAWKWKVKVKLLNRVQLLATPWTAAHQAPLSMGFSRQEYWGGVPLPSPRAASRNCIRWENWFFPSVPNRNAALPNSLIWAQWNPFQISGLQNFKTIKLCCLSHNICSNLLQPLLGTSTIPHTHLIGTIIQVLVVIVPSLQLERLPLREVICPKLHS